MTHARDSNTGSDGLWDVLEGVQAWRLWAYLGLVDIRQRYRRSMLGPLWLAFGLGATVLGVGLLYSRVLSTPAPEYVPFLAASLWAWQLLATVLVEATTLFATSAVIITSVRMPYTSLVLRSIVRNLIVAAHGLAVVLIVFVWYRVEVSPVALLAIPGVILLCINLYWMALIIALISARFRDVGQIVIYLMSLMLFLTPVIWMPTQLHPGSVFLMFNPLAHLIAIVRDPIVFGTIPVQSLLVCSGMAVAGVIAGAFIFARLRRYVAYWT